VKLQNAFCKTAKKTGFLHTFWSGKTHSETIGEIHKDVSLFVLSRVIKSIATRPSSKNDVKNGFFCLFLVCAKMAKR